jgi:hypothetical protein
LVGVVVLFCRRHVGVSIEPGLKRDLHVDATAVPAITNGSKWIATTAAGSWPLHDSRPSVNDS